MSLGGMCGGICVQMGFSLLERFTPKRNSVRVYAWVSLSICVCEDQLGLTKLNLGYAVKENSVLITSSRDC